MTATVATIGLLRPLAYVLRTIEHLAEEPWRIPVPWPASVASTHRLIVYQSYPDNWTIFTVLSPFYIDCVIFVVFLSSVVYIFALLIPSVHDLFIKLCGVAQKTGTLLYALTSYAITLSNIGPFSNLFHCLNQENICNNTVTKDPTTPQVCRYTTLWNVSVLKATIENKTTSVKPH